MFLEKKQFIGRFYADTKTVKKCYQLRKEKTKLNYRKL